MMLILVMVIILFAEVIFLAGVICERHYARRN